MRRLAACLFTVAVVSVACTSSSPEAQPPPVSPSPSASPSGTPEPAPTWAPIARAPISGRTFNGVVWSGSEMIVWGGVHRSAGGGEQLADGAAYDPSTDSWEKLAPAPAGLKGGGGQAAAWTGSEAAFWVGNSPDGPVGTAVYDPVAGSWHRLPAGPLGVREGYVSVWTGSRLLIMGGAAGDQLATPIGAGLFPAAGTWRLLGGLNALTGFVPSGAVWSGKEAFLYGSTSQCPQLGSGCQDYTPTFVSYAPASDTAKPISLKGIPVPKKQLTTLAPVAWTGSAVLFNDLTSTATAVVTYTPATRTWAAGPPAPCAAAPNSVGQVAWAGSVLVEPCGKNQLQLYDPSRGTWTLITAGPSPLNSMTSSSIVWTGSKLIVWSGGTSSTANATPNRGVEIDLSAYAHG
jgi:hypothetical protein